MSEKIILTADGNIQTVYRDKGIANELISMDSATLVRASDVEFEAGHWVSRLKNGIFLCAGKNRAKVVKREHEIIEGMMARGVKIPADNLKNKFARWIRKFANSCRKSPQETTATLN